MSEMDYNEYKKTALNQLKERFKKKKNILIIISLLKPTLIYINFKLFMIKPNT